MGLPHRSSGEEVFPHAEITRKQLESCLANLDRFLDRYLPCFYRTEQREHARTYIQGLLSDLPRKTIEPIATDHGQHRRPLQRFIGAGCWSDEKILTEFRGHVRQEIGDPNGIIAIDPSGFPKKGTESVGVKRQWCGRLGKQDNCQIGVYLAYIGSGSSTLIDKDIYLPREWCRSRARRLKCHVPKGLRFRTTGRIALDLLKKNLPLFPHAWCVGDDEFGRPAWFRKALARLGERYILDVPSNTRIRDLNAPSRKRHRRQAGRPPQAPFVRVSDWSRQQPASAWTQMRVADGEKGPLVVEAIRTSVQTYVERRPGPRETLVITRTLGSDPEYRYYLSNAEGHFSLHELVRVAKDRHRIEECIQRAKGEAGLDEYEVRSWVGWQHHMTLSLLATWLLTLEARRVGKKDPRGLRPAHGDGFSHAVA